MSGLDNLSDSERRAEVYSYNTCLASSDVIGGTTWLYNPCYNTHTLYEALGNSRQLLTIIGKVSPIGLQASTHGNFDPMSDGVESSADLSLAAIKFSLVKPENRGFAKDFEDAFARVKGMIDLMQFSRQLDEPMKPFLVEDMGLPRFSFNHALFELKTSSSQKNYYQPEYGPDSLSDYIINPQYQSQLNELKMSHYSRAFVLWDGADRIHMPELGEYLSPNKLVCVKFRLEFTKERGLVADVVSATVIL